MVQIGAAVLGPLAVAAELPPCNAVVEVHVGEIHKLADERRRLHGRQCLDAVAQVARHGVGRAQQDRVAPVAIAEPVHPAVLQEAAHDAAHRDVLAHAGDAGDQTADASHDEVDAAPLL